MQKNDLIVSAAVDEEKPVTVSYEFLNTDAIDPFFS